MMATGWARWGVAALLLVAACQTAPPPPPPALPPPPPPEPAPTAPIAEAPPPPVPVTVPRAFIVFFDTGKATLSRDAREIIANAASAYRAHKAQVLFIAGHTDRVGSARANRRLSMRRALSVRRAFMEAGIPSSEIGITARGEAEPAFLTPDKMPEPQNRRVEIRF